MAMPHKFIQKNIGLLYSNLKEVYSKRVVSEESIIKNRSRSPDQWHPFFVLGKEKK